MMSDEGRRAVSKAATLRRIRERLLARRIGAHRAAFTPHSLGDQIVPDEDFDHFLSEKGW